ncbi:hypothetical protein Tco_1293776 [Tanacetum coccineum]
MGLRVADSHTGNHREDGFTPLETIQRFLSIIGSKSLLVLKGRPSSRRGGPAASSAGLIGIKHRHNVVCDTLVDICFHSEILSSKEVDIKLNGGVTNPDSQLILVDATQCKHVKYEAQCIDFGYGFLSFSLSSFKEEECGDLT